MEWHNACGHTGVAGLQYIWDKAPSASRRNSIFSNIRPAATYGLWRRNDSKLAILRVLADLAQTEVRMLGDL